MSVYAPFSAEENDGEESEREPAACILVSAFSR